MNESEIRVGKPCRVDWAAMTPKDRGRFCADCKKVVHELAKMTEAEARTLLAGADGAVCVRYVYDARGKVFFADSPRDLVPSTLLVRAKRAALMVAAPLAIAACSNAIDGTEMMGEPAYNPTPLVEEDDAGDGGDAGNDARPDGAEKDAADGSRPDADPDGGADAKSDSFVPPP